jgi:hypothetical protein
VCLTGNCNFNIYFVFPPIGTFSGRNGSIIGHASRPGPPNLSLQVPFHAQVSTLFPSPPEITIYIREFWQIPYGGRYISN